MNTLLDPLATFLMLQQFPFRREPWLLDVDLRED
jgi:hypothetical protein